MSFIKSSATKCVSLNNEPCMIRPFLINLTHDEIKYYPFLIKLDKYNRNFNPVNDLSMRMCVPSKTKDVNVKVFNMITKGNEAKTPAKHNSSIANTNSLAYIVIQIKNGIMNHINVSVKIVVQAKYIINGILAHVFVRMVCI